MVTFCSCGHNHVDTPATAEVTTPSAVEVVVGGGVEGGSGMLYFLA
jgi:hypothetical protein